MLFKSFFNWLKPGGKVLISDYCKSSGTPSEEFAEYIKQRGYDLHDVEAYGQMLKDAGFYEVIAEDRTTQFVEVLQRELDAIEKDKDAFTQDFSEVHKGGELHKEKDRFTEALHYYSTMFDLLESGGEQKDQVMSDVYLGKQIMSVIGCEGAEPTKRHETLSQWQGRLNNAGFDTVHLGSNAFKQASTLLALFAGGHGYRVEEKDGSSIRLALPC